MPHEEEQVNNAFSKAAVWVIIALVLFTVFRQFETRQSRVGDIPYSQFMKEAENGQVDSVQIDGRACASAPATAVPCPPMSRPPVTSGWSAT